MIEKNDYDKETLNEIKKSREEVEKEVSFLEQADEKELKKYFGLLTAKDLNKYNRDNQYIIDEKMENYLKDIKEPLKANEYLVELPECFGILPNEVVEFNWDNEQVILKIRESIDSHQLQKAYDLLKTKNHTIIFKQLKPDLSVDYTVNFKNCQLNHIQVITSSYNNDNFKCFYLILKYKELMFV